MRHSALSLLLVLFGSTASLAAQGDDQRRIEDARARSNAAIAAHDVEGILAEIGPDFHITAGTGRFIEGREAMGEAFAGQFEQFADALYVRTPESIEVGDGATRAFESGAWVGTWTTPEGPLRTGGRYSAYWSKIEGSWKLRTEVFVTLYCEGDGCDARRP